MTTAEDSLEEKRNLALLSWIRQLAPYGVLTLDPSLKVQSWNRWMEAHSFLPEAKVIGRTLLEIFPELEVRRLMPPFQRALDGESSVLATALHRYILPLKSPFSIHKGNWMRQTTWVTPLLADGKVCGVVVVIEDVTQREIQAECLELQHRRDEALSWALVHLLQSDEPRKTVRQVFFKIAEHLDFDTFLLYLRDTDSDTVTLYAAGGISNDLQRQFHEYEILSKIADGEVPVTFTAVKKLQDPDYALLKEAKISAAIAIPLRADGKSLGVLCFASGSRDHIALEESDLLKTIAQYLAAALNKESMNRELRSVVASNQWMGAIVESTDDAIISKDLDGVIKSCNQGAARLFGYEIDELIGKPMRMLIPEHLQYEETDILQRIRSGKRIEHFETIRQRKDGRLIHVSLVISPVIDATGKVLGASKIARDITERRLAEQKLAESLEREKLAREKAEMANHAKDDFLAALSHELRTPLNPILLIASDASEDASLSPEIKDRFETILKNIELEARLIDDLLDITRISHGKLSLHFRLVDVKVILEETVRNVSSDLREKQIELKFEFNTSQKHVQGDDVRLQQIFWNVLKNAVKFTPRHGRITISVNVIQDWFQISIADTGIGITPNEIERIFEAFSQGDHTKNNAHRFGGIGLGLAIARKLVEMHAGRIKVASEGLDKGSTFTIQLPVGKPEKAPLTLPLALKNQTVHEQNEAKPCILLVEDHDPTRITLSTLLSRRGYQVIAASSALEARNMPALEKIDVVISDIGLPDGNGNELMKYLSTTFGLKGIALTGYGMEEDIENCLAAGFVTHLIKPVGIHALENALKTLLNR